MFHAKKFFNICTKLYKLPIESYFIHKRIINHRQFQTSASVRDKAFINYENIYAHSILERNEKCCVLRGEQNIENIDQKCVDIDFDRNWSSLTTDDILEHLRMIGSYCKNNGVMISDKRFDKFVDICTERCFDFTDDQLIKSLQILIHYPQAQTPKSRNYVELWSALDEACVERIGQWDFDKILYLCDHWHMLNLGRLNVFNTKGSLKIGRKLRKLPTHQLVQIMFYVNIKRSPLLEMFEFETNLVKSLDELSLNEISVMCMGFFKTQTKLKTPDLVANIFKRLIGEIDTVEDIPFVCIIKALRYSSTHNDADLIKELLDVANDQIPRLSSLSCLHLALLGTNIHICHQSCMEQIVRRFADDVKSIRIKDIERITFVIGLFDFESDSRIEHQLCRNILDELKQRVDDIIEYPQCLPLCLHYLTMKGYYDEELISVALSKKFVHLAYGGNQFKYGRELFALDSYVKINLKETYRGDELTETNRQYMGKMLTQYIPNRSGEFRVSATDKILLELEETTLELYNHCYFAHVLPHFDRPDIIIAYDKRTNTGIDIAHNLPEFYTGKIIDRPMLIEGLSINPSDVEIINIVIGGWNNYVKETNKLNGLLKLKVEQLKAVGIRPVLIPWFDWTRLLQRERTHYIKHKISNTLKQK